MHVGTIDYRFALSGFSPLAFITALLGTTGIIGISMAIERIQYLREIFLMWGRNSLFVMATHEYLKLKDLIMAIVLCAIPTLSDNMQILVEIIGIIIVEWALSLVLAQRVEKLIEKYGTVIYKKMLREN